MHCVFMRNYYKLGKNVRLDPIVRGSFMSKLYVSDQWKDAPQFFSPNCKLAFHSLLICHACTLSFLQFTSLHNFLWSEEQTQMLQMLTKPMLRLQIPLQCGYNSLSIEHSLSSLSKIELTQTKRSWPLMAIKGNAWGQNRIPSIRENQGKSGKYIHLKMYFATGSTTQQARSSCTPPVHLSDVEEMAICFLLAQAHV